MKATSGCHSVQSLEMSVNSFRFSFMEKKSKKADPDEDKGLNENLKELKDQCEKIEFDIFMKLFSIIRYIIDNIPSLPLGVANRILNKHDFIMIFVNAVELQMWNRTSSEGKFYKYVDNKWKCVTLEERSQLTKSEGQIWIAVYELLLNPACSQKYDYTDYKKSQIIKASFNEFTIKQKSMSNGSYLYSNILFGHVGDMEICS